MKRKFSRIAILALALIVMAIITPARALAAPAHQAVDPVVGVFQDLTINGLSFLVLVVGIVQASRKLGVSGRWLTALALVLGVALATGYQVAQVAPAFKLWFDIFVYGLGGGVAAAGYYDLYNERFPKVRPGSDEDQVR